MVFFNKNMCKIYYKICDIWLHFCMLKKLVRPIKSLVKYAVVQCNFMILQHIFTEKKNGKNSCETCKMCYKIYAILQHIFGGEIG